MTIGLCEISTIDRTFPFKSLRATGCDVIRAEKRSGTSAEGCEELHTVLDFLRERWTIARGVLDAIRPTGGA